MSNNIKDFFALSFEDTGVYLEINGDLPGDAADRGAVIVYLKRKGIAGLNTQAVLDVIKEGRGRTKIAPRQEENIINGDLEIEISKDGMSAKIKLLPPDPGGSEITTEAAMRKLAQSGVVFGIDEQALIEAVNDKNYNRTYVAAAGKSPENGKDGRLIFHFNTEKRTARPREIEGGRVDYKTLDLVEPVSEGQILVSIEPETPGTPGKTVMGVDIKQTPGRKAAMPRSKNTVLSDDKTAMYAKTSGMVEYDLGSVNVSNVYKVEGDCDLGVGNIDFDGSVYITGNVITGNVIKASGSVMIDGVVEASEIIAGGNVNIKRGMQGMGKGRIVAAGTVTIQYIERGAAVAGGSIVIDAAIHSELEAGGSVIAKGKRGSIIGGLVRVAGEVTANSLGSNSHPQTEIEVGIVPQKRQRIEFLEKELMRIKEELDKLDKLDIYLEKSKDRITIENWEKLSRSGAENRRINSQLFADYSEEIIGLHKETENAVNGRVHVFGTTFPGVKITIASAIYRVNDDIERSTFKLKDGEIVFLPCEARQA